MPDVGAQAWVNFNSTEREQTLIEKFSGTSGPGWTFSKLSGNRLQFYARPSIVLTTEAISIPNGTWHDILVRRTPPFGYDRKTPLVSTRHNTEMLGFERWILA